MSTCPTNPIVITKGSRDTGLCQRDTNVNTNFGLTQKQNYANIVNNPYITRSCEENIIDETKTIDTSSDDDNDNFFETVVNVINQRHSDNTIPVGYENNINNAMNLVSLVNNTIDELDSSVAKGVGCDYISIKM